ncbi:major sperm protein, putative [Ixodes scapularis]|uniref:Major sperm protein, putative n=1 Tax=Ixodes scapularis TaxID=6945 RepID=B7Q6Q7_IXOSC|nr:major sperm protein, putative [Ixodes scapularis]|eukprot:XP_002412020.1 major sperm protein, putative [Ixodes scapularis]
MVPYNTDKFGSHIVTLRVKLHRKEASVVDLMKKFFAYFVDKILYEHDAIRVTVIFDCTDAGVSNVVRYIIVHNMPWILNAVWKIIKTMLPSEGVERIRFTTKDGILDYVDRQNLAKYMGGEDPYVYNYEKGKPLGERCPLVSYPKVVIPP